MPYKDKATARKYEKEWRRRAINDPTRARCNTPACDRTAMRKGMCDACYLIYQRIGSTQRTYRTKDGHGGGWKGGRTLSKGGYTRIHMSDHHRATSQGYVYEHILIAEYALGHALTGNHPIHHVNEDRSDNRNTNLVICESSSYHKLLHRRRNAWLRKHNNNNDDVLEMGDESRDDAIVNAQLRLIEDLNGNENGNENATDLDLEVPF